MLTPEFYAPLRTASAQFHASADGLAAAGRLFELIELEAPVAANGAAPEPGILRLEQFGFSYPERGRVLDGVDLELQPGERVAIVGPSGAGKSTLLALLLRFVDADAGRATVDGIDLATVSPADWRRQLAWVPQRPLLEPGTVAEAVRLGGASAADAEVATALAAAGLAVRLDAEVHKLSAGEQRRVAFARALLRRAPLLLLDEPTAHLDSSAAEQIIDVLAALPRTRAVIVATHDLRVLRAADRVLELRGGRLSTRRAGGGSMKRRFAAAIVLSTLTLAAGAALLATSGYLISRAATRPDILSLTVVDRGRPLLCACARGPALPRTARLARRIVPLSVARARAVLRPARASGPE